MATKYWLILALSLLLAPALFAVPVQCDTAATFADLIAFDSNMDPGCLITDKLFLNFDFSGTALNAPTPTANSIAVDIISLGLQVGFDFTLPLSVSANASQDVRLQYGVVSMAGATIIDAHLAMNGSQSGSGSATVTENLCFGNSQPPCMTPDVTLKVESSPTLVKLSDAAFFAPVERLTVDKDVNVSGGLDGTAQISGVINTISQVPEPGTMFLIGAGLLGLRFLKRR